MPTYIYETVHDDDTVTPRRFEVFQKMSDEPLREDPATGEPVRRIVTGGLGLKLPGLKRSTMVNKKSAAATACGCATGIAHSVAQGISQEKSGKTQRPRIGQSHGHGHGHHTHGPGCGHHH